MPPGDEMKLSSLAIIKTNFQNAHFWLVRRGSAAKCGEPTRIYNPEHIGILVVKTDILLPDYLYYALVHVHSTGHWERIATGTLSLVNIKVSDVQNIELSPT